MSALHRLHDLTENIIVRIKMADKNNREEVVSEFDQFVEEREKLLKGIKGPYTDEEKELGSRLVELDQQLQSLVQNYLSSFRTDMVSFQRKKVSNKRYTNPYASLYGRDGSFIDKKN
ncbi:hypothetical protein CEY16_08715 [Halalkalibacillus sediminis]|uniref:Flagellar protein FliT n=1 Tax=Halalkalibacillus sediminis TaxID=2018042 RepID=A0A2I0QUG0_9BACI|nr:hypothetical protein [Halalkalibacillus sediminis]PKR77992.1 hypothetical protein CEY16_08715 [Halalkalibacillus sediminis]